jgi:hypothetical protein
MDEKTLDLKIESIFYRIKSMVLWLIRYA